MRERERLLASIAATIGNYRAGEIAAPTPDHIERWISQFGEGVREPMLTELDHVMKQTYIPKATVQTFLSNLLKNQKLAGADPCSFWRNVKFLDIQAGGNSQRDMLAMFNSALQAECGFGIQECGSDPEAYVYLDDALFSGNRVRNDLSSWVRSTAPEKAKAFVVMIALHRGGQYYASQAIQDAARAVKKEIALSWWRCIEIEDRRAYTDSSDVLRPVSVPDDELVRTYVAGFTHQPVLRRPGQRGENQFFSSEDGRHLLEQELLKAGVSIRSRSPYLNIYQRPLGNMVLETLGFGSLIVTFRNCPNNCPLAFWAGDPWYPLFPRKTN